MESDNHPNTFKKKDSHVEKVEDIKSKAESDTTQKIEEWCVSCKEQCKKYKEEAHKYIKENPEKSFFMGIGIGALLALILMRRR